MAHRARLPRDDTEALVILHTRKALVPQIIERTKTEHADDTPQVIALAVTDANPDYRHWLLEVTGGSTATS